MNIVKNSFIAVTGFIIIFFFTNPAYSQECKSPVLCAKFEKQTVSQVMAPGTTQTVIVSYKNTGSETWGNGTVSLEYVDTRINPQDKNVWGVDNILMLNESNIFTGDKILFLFTIRAPSKPGTYNFEWQMKSLGTNFGYSSTSTQIKVL